MIGALLTVGLFTFPGSLILLDQRFFPKLHYVEKIPLVTAASLSYWIMSFWLLKYLPVPLHLLICLSLAITALATVVLFGKRHRLPKKPVCAVTINGALILWFLILAAPSIILTQRQLAPSGADMSMHAYIAKAIYRADGFPTTLRPLVPQDTFGVYPVGFPTIVADMMLVNHLPVYTNTLWLTAYTYWFFAAGIYTLLRMRFSFVIGAITTILIAWVSITPHDIISWGANPTVLSLNFLIIAAIYFLHCPYPGSLFGMGLSVYTAFLVHYMLPVGCGYLSLLLLPVVWTSLKHLLQRNRKIRWAIPACILLTLPFVIHQIQGFQEPPDTAYQYVTTLQKGELLEWTGTPYPSLIAGTTRFITNTLGREICTLFLVALGVLALRRRHTLLVSTVFVGGIYILIINAAHWRLPLSVLLYPKRIVLLLLIPASCAIAEALDIIIRYIYRHFVVKNARNLTILSILTIFLVGHIYTDRIRISLRGFIGSSTLSVVTQEDIDAMAWLAIHTTHSDIITNNYMDAGIWIPAIADRYISRYHTNPIDMDRLDAQNSGETYAYIGNKSLSSSLNADPVNENTLGKAPKRYSLMYKNGRAAIYRVERDE